MRVFLKILLIIALLPGCTPETRKPAVTVDPEVEIRQLLADGRYQKAVDEYQRLAQLYPDKSDYYRLQAAAALVSMARATEAAELIAQLRPQNDYENALKTLLQAEILLLDRQPEKTLKLLQDAYPEDVLQARRHRLRARAYELQANFISAAEERVRYHAYLQQFADIQANSGKIWEDLNKTDKETLRRFQRLTPAAMAGWLELALINQTLLTDPDTLTRALATWQENYPAHPANSAIIEEIRAAGRLYNIRPQRIALLLPLRGAYRQAAEAIRDGFISAWYDSGQFHPPVKIYEANSLNIERAYAQAVAEGADFVVGPLEKQALKKLSATVNLTVPTLALNRIGPAPEPATDTAENILPALMQFGLAPEDEARQIAERAYGDGYGRALAIIPDDPWGRRLHAAFQESWTALGGVTLRTTAYKPQSNDLGAPVRQLLNISGSEFRARQLRQALGRRLESRSRRRQDADMVFMAAAPIAGRQIMPQLRFFEAGQLPVYATSHIFTGSVNRQADADMNGVVFPDLPWILFADADNSSLKARINDNFRAASSVYQRLYAFGADAFHLILQLPRLAYEDGAEFNGATGRLSLSDDGRIDRKLPWGKIINGKPVLLGDG